MRAVDSGKVILPLDRTHYLEVANITYVRQRAGWHRPHRARARWPEAAHAKLEHAQVPHRSGLEHELEAVLACDRPQFTKLGLLPARNL